MLLDQKEINEQVTVFKETILNVFRNFLRNKYITAHDKGPV